MIRIETPQDYRAVRRIIQQAFSNSTEHLLVEKLRQNTAFVPQLSLVKEIHAAVVGYILLTEVNIGQHTLLALAPLAVHPLLRKQGIGSELVDYAHQVAAKLGYEAIVVLGAPAYYHRFGYETSTKYRIESPFDVPEQYFMVKKLVENIEHLEGVVKYSAPFEQ